MSYSNNYYDNISGNEFLNLFYEYYEAINFPEEKDFKEIKNLFGKVVKKENMKEKKLFESILFKVDDVRNNSPSFERLFDFASFVRSMESVFFYKNDKDATIACDHNIKEARIRDLYFNYEDYYIELYLKKDYDPSKSTIEITVNRKYGKELSTQFICKNRDVIYDIADEHYLMIQINKIIQNEMADFFLECVNKYIKKKEDKPRYYDFTGKIIDE